MRHQIRVIVAALAVSSIALGVICVRSAEGIDNKKALDELYPEINRLKEKIPLKVEVRVTVLEKGLYGWWQAASEGPRIFIVNKGKEQNIKTLRHEWEHARQFCANEPYSEEKAYAAEKVDK